MKESEDDRMSSDDSSGGEEGSVVVVEAGIRWMREVNMLCSSVRCL